MDSLARETEIRRESETEPLSEPIREAIQGFIQKFLSGGVKIKVDYVIILSNTFCYLK